MLIVFARNAYQKRIIKNCEVWRNSIPLQYKRPPKGQDNFKLVRHIRVLIIQGSNVFNTALIISLSLCSAVILIALLL